MLGWPGNIYVKKIVLKTAEANINYVRFFMSNGLESPVFETSSGDKGNERAFELDEPNNQVKKVRASDKNDHKIFKVCLLSFDDTILH